MLMYIFLTHVQAWKSCQVLESVLGCFHGLCASLNSEQWAEYFQASTIIMLYEAWLLAIVSTPCVV